MHILIYGAGGAGGYFGAQLARAGEEVTFLARGPHLQAIKRDGLRIETPDGEMVIQPAQATDDPSAVGKVDVVILGVKAWQVTDAAKAMRPVIGENTFVVTLQNGVDAPGELSAVLGAEHAAGGTCAVIAWLTGPGRIRSVVSTGICCIRFGELDNRQSERVTRLRQAFERSGTKVEVPDDIKAALWSKFLIVTAFGGVGAVTRAPIGVTRALPETRRMLEQCMQETLAVARARGIALADRLPADSMAVLDSLGGNGTTSLQRDIADGKRTELDYWNGAVVRLGREAGVATPTHDFIYRSLLPLHLQAEGKVAFPA
jgi:2-dehydropantoate 2-reductase